jgi:TetR/AcrR family transcriptional regulator, cholesterol catabolism regulator
VTAVTVDEVRDARAHLVALGFIAQDGGGRPDEGTRERLLTAAIALFAERGFDGCTMRDLATAVGVKAPAIYNHFVSKEQILAEASRHALVRFFTDVIGPLDEDPPEHRLEGVVRRWITFQIEDREIAHANDALLDTGVLKRALPAQDWEPIHQALRTLVGLLRSLVAERAAEDVDVATATRAVTAVCDRVGLSSRASDGHEHEAVATQAWVLIERMLGARR